VQRFTGREKADIAVVMFGANDRLDLRESGASVRFRTDEWRAAYAARANKILTLLTTAGLKVIWCGNPIARSPVYSADMNYINDIYAEETARFGARFVPRGPPSPTSRAATPPTARTAAARRSGCGPMTASTSPGPVTS